MDQEKPTLSDSDSGASTLSRLESFLSAEDAPDENQDQDKQADAQEANDESGKADEQEQTEESPEYQLADVAKLLGADESLLDVDEDGSVIIKTKIDGEEGTAKFQDVLKVYQLQGHVDKQVREVAEMRKSAEYQQQQVQQQMQIQHAVMEQSIEIRAIESELNAYSQVDWNAWYDQDPANAAKASHKLQELQQNLAKKYAEANQKAAQFQTNQEQLKNQALQYEHEQLIRAIPEWSNVSVQREEKQAIHKFLVDRGVNPEINDHKLLLVIREAMQYKHSQNGKEKTVQAVRAAPKISKPGSSQSVNRQAQNIKQLHANVKAGKSGSVRDYLLATGTV